MKYSGYFGPTVFKCIFRLRCSQVYEGETVISLVHLFHMNRKDLLSVDDIEQIVGKKRKSNKEERMASVKVFMLTIVLFICIGNHALASTIRD